MAKDMYQKRKERKEAKVNNNESCHKTSINWYPGHMAKTKKQIIEDLKLIDVVVEILDARIPMSSRNPNIQEYIKEKNKVVVLNKADLADEEQNKKWKEYFNKNGISAVITDSNSGKGIDEVIKQIEKVSKEDQKKYEEKGRSGRSIRVIILGIPNVGKSSFINRVTKKNVAQVGNRPGVTRQKQWTRINSNIDLLDTPGVLWPKFESQEVALNLAYTGTIKDDILEKVEIAYYLLKFLLENYKKNVLERYKLDEKEIEEILHNENNMENENVMEVMYKIGQKRGTIVSGGNIDEEKVSNIILDDFRSGKLGKITVEKCTK